MWCVKRKSRFGWCLVKREQRYGAYICPRCNTRPPIQEADVSGNVRQKETISRVIAPVKCMPRFLEIRASRSGCRWRSLNNEVAAVYSRSVTGNLSLISEVTRKTALNRRVTSRTRQRRAYRNELSCISCKQYKICRIDSPALRTRRDNNFILAVHARLHRGVKLYTRSYQILSDTAG